MKKLLLLSTLCILLTTGCLTKPDKTTDLLKKQGYTDIVITGMDILGCGEDDFYRTGFSAKKGENTIDGTGCAGFLFKGATIRFK